jgi:hypothetical protein
MTPTTLTFTQLNKGWNADPNAPYPKVTVSGTDVLLEFLLNPLQFPQFARDDRGIILFSRCARYLLGGTNDEGWYRGQCRYSKIAPAWGEFYEISGPDPRLDGTDEWQVVDAASNASRHFLFYLRDETFECIAERWEANSTNARFRHLGAG